MSYHRLAGVATALLAVLLLSPVTAQDHSKAKQDISTNTPQGPQAQNQGQSPGEWDRWGFPATAPQRSRMVSRPVRLPESHDLEACTYGLAAARLEHPDAVAFADDATRLEMDGYMSNYHVHLVSLDKQNAVLKNVVAPGTGAVRSFDASFEPSAARRVLVVVETSYDVYPQDARYDPFLRPPLVFCIELKPARDMERTLSAQPFARNLKPMALWVVSTSYSPTDQVLGVYAQDRDVRDYHFAQMPWWLVRRFQLRVLTDSKVTQKVGLYPYPADMSLDPSGRDIEVWIPEGDGARPVGKLPVAPRITMRAIETHVKTEATITFKALGLPEHHKYRMEWYWIRAGQPKFSVGASSFDRTRSFWTGEIKIAENTHYVTAAVGCRMVPEWKPAAGGPEALVLAAADSKPSSTAITTLFVKRTAIVPAPNTYLYITFTGPRPEPAAADSDLAEAILLDDMAAQIGGRDPLDQTFLTPDSRITFSPHMVMTVNVGQGATGGITPFAGGPFTTNPGLPLAGTYDPRAPYYMSYGGFSQPGQWDALVRSMGGSHLYGQTVTPSGGNLSGRLVP